MISMKRYIGLGLILFLIGCKTKQATLSSETIKSLSISQIISKNIAHKLEFKTLYIKSKARYEDSKQSQNVTTDIRIEKDKQILVSIRVLGITLAKALIAPDRVQYYEKIDNTFFEGDFKGLSQWLGVELDFDKIQNMLIGNTLYDLASLKLTNQVEENQYLLIDNSKKIEKKFYFQTDDVLLTEQNFKSKILASEFKIQYKNFQTSTAYLFPYMLKIDANKKDKNVAIVMKHDTVTFDEEFSFPYSVPKGYKQIFID